MKVSIITVVFNAISEFKLLIQSIENIDRNSYELVVVFNGCNLDYSVVSDLLENSDITHNLIRCDNLGFAHGCNIGVASSKYDIIWLLNSDCIITPSTLNEMLTKYNNNPRAIIGSKIMKFDGSVQCYGGGTLNYTIGFQSQSTKLESIDFITGASLMISKRDYISLGKIDESFFLYWEETDFCMKAKNNGMPLIVAENAVVYHSIGASTDITSLFTEYYSTRNAIAFFKKYTSKKRFIIVVLSNVIIKTFNRIVRLQFNRIPAILTAIYDGCMGNLGLNKRLFN